MKPAWLLGVGLSLGSAPLARSQTVAAHGIVAWHWTDPSADQAAEHRLQLVHPMIMAHRSLGRAVSIRATANFEGITIPEGELALGNWGEGFVDRRHPHGYLHELIADAAFSSCGGRCQLGAFAGKGFVPFGSDDPMTRDQLRYPVNHHLAQIVERAILGGQIAVRQFRLEAATFNGDEPERPGQFPRIGGRFGDSWAGRFTAIVAEGLEASISLAHVASPEHRPGAGASQEKRHVGASYRGGRTSALIEWARTSELAGFFTFESLVVEAARNLGPGRFAVRFERTERPEEERLSPTRSARPHLENSILGTSRWTSLTITASAAARSVGPVRLFPTLEATRGAIAAGPGAFRVVDTYGRTAFWAVSLGLRMDVGSTLGIGRYGLRRVENGRAHLH